MNSSVIRRDLVLSLCAILVVLGYVLFAGGNFPLDDSWIHQTYGRNLGLYGEWAFIRGEPSAASTSPLYTVLLAIGYFLRLPYLWWTHGLGIVALASTAILGARMAETLSSQFLPMNSLKTSRIAWGTGLALVGTWHLIWAASAGMETMLFGLFTLILIALAWRELKVESDSTSQILRRGLVFGVATALTALARPEGLLLAGMVALLMLIVRPQGSLGRVIVWGIGAALGFALFISPYLVLNWQLTNGFLPNTAGAKFKQHEVLLNLPYTLRYYRLSLQILAGGQVLFLIGALAYIKLFIPLPVYGEGQGWGYWKKSLFALLPLFWSLSLIALYAARLPADYQHGRYVMPALPSFILIGAVGTVYLWHMARRSMLGRILSQTLLISLGLLYAYFLVLGATIYRVDVAIIDSEMVMAAHWIADNLPEDELLAIHDIGAVGYFAPRPMLDIAGLLSPELVPIVADGDALWRVMEERGAVYLMAFPDQIPNDNVNDSRLCEIYSTNAEITRSVGHPNMKIYRLAYDGQC